MSATKVEFTDGNVDLNKIVAQSTITATGSISSGSNISSNAALSGVTLSVNGTDVSTTVVNLNAKSGTSVYETKAATGTVAANAASISADLVVVTGADDTAGVIISTARAVSGSQMMVVNNASSNLKVYPPTNAAINLLNTNSSLTMAANTTAIFGCQSNTQFWTCPRVPS